MKDWYQYQGETGITGSRDAIRMAFRDGLLGDGHSWMEMLRSRNRAADTYNESVAREVADLIGNRFYPRFREFLSTMTDMEQREIGGGTD